MNRKTFEEGLHKIEISFTGFEMTKEKADLWFSLTDLTDSEWLKKVDNCIKYCYKRVPVLADILDLKNQHIQEATAYPQYVPDDDYEYKPMPDEIKEKMNKLTGKFNINLKEE